MAERNARPQAPVAPDGMEILFFYQCPQCGRHVPVVAPTEPRMITCDGCRASFPIIPVDEHGLPLPLASQRKVGPCHSGAPPLPAPGLSCLPPLSGAVPCPYPRAGSCPIPGFAVVWRHCVFPGRLPAVRRGGGPSPDMALSSTGIETEATEAS